MNVRRLLSVLALIAGVTTAPSAFAVCLGVVSYTASPAGTSVVVTPDNLTRRVCRMGGTEIMLRQNIETGAIVRMPDACSGQGWRDECVPRGTYRYGFAMPYECCPQCCNTDYFIEITVMLDPPANCEATRDPANPRPMPYAGQAPWAATKEICRFVPLPDSGVRPPRRDAAPEPDPTGGMPTGTGGAPRPRDRQPRVATTPAAARLRVDVRWAGRVGRPRWRSWPGWSWPSDSFACPGGSENRVSRLDGLVVAPADGRYPDADRRPGGGRGVGPRRQSKGIVPGPGRPRGRHGDAGDLPQGVAAAGPAKAEREVRGRSRRASFFARATEAGGVRARSPCPAGWQAEQAGPAPLGHRRGGRAGAKKGSVPGADRPGQRRAAEGPALPER